MESIYGINIERIENDLKENKIKQFKLDKYNDDVLLFMYNHYKELVKNNENHINILNDYKKTYYKQSLKGKENNLTSVENFFLELHNNTADKINFLRSANIIYNSIIFIFVKELDKRNINIDNG